MAVAQGYGKTVTSGSVFAYDTGDTRNSYIGEPTTNIYSTDGYSFWQLNGNHTATRYTGNAPDLTTILNNYDYHTIVTTGNWSNEVDRALLWTNSGLLQLNTQYAVSFYARVISTSTANIGAAFYGNALPNSLTLTNQWQRFTVLTSTTATYRPFEFGSKSGAITFQVAGIQYEAKSHSTPYVNSTRSATQGLLPLAGNSTLDLSNVSFDSNAQMTFDGTNDYLDFNAPNLSGTATVEMVCKIGSGYSDKMFFGWLLYDVWCGGGNLGYNTANGDVYGISSSTVSSLGLVNTWKHYVFEMRSDVSYSNNKIYINGVSQTLSQQQGSESSGNRNFNSGNGRIADWRTTGYYMPMECPVFRVYNRALSANEIKQNFDFYDARFGLDVDSYYFAVSNRFAQVERRTYPGGTEVIVRARNMATTTPAYILYQKPDASKGIVANYTEIARDDIGSPTRLTTFGTQTSYSNGRYLTSVTVRKSRKSGRLFFEFPDGGTSQYGEAFYRSIITPHVP